MRRWLWAPWLGCYGVQRLTLLRNVLVVAGAGVGGGSLNYANTLYTPPQAFYDDPQWRDITDWRTELAPHYDQAQRMLGVAENPTTTPADEHLRAIAIEMGVENTYRRTPVGVLFSAPGQRPGDDVDDPFFGGAGPRRRSCTECGSCMTGCRVGAKNTMVKNYLYLAERSGAVVHAETTGSGLRPLEDGVWAVNVRPSRVTARPQHRTLRAQHVVLAAGTLGTQRLLHRMRDRGVLPNLSHRLGQLSRTNSEAILVASARDRRVDYSRGVAITSSFHPDESTHMDPARYGRGSNAMGLLAGVGESWRQPSTDDHRAFGARDVVLAEPRGTRSPTTIGIQVHPHSPDGTGCACRSDSCTRRAGHGTLPGCAISHGVMCRPSMVGCRLDATEVRNGRPRSRATGERADAGVGCGGGWCLAGDCEQGAVRLTAGE